MWNKPSHLCCLLLNIARVFEFYYAYRPLAGLQVRPNIQYVIDPGGTSANSNVLVFGLKTVANF
jgi:porin